MEIAILGLVALLVGLTWLFCLLVAWLKDRQ
jgi:hypothetical protein